MISNLNLDNIKVVIFDYDGTLAVHRDKDFVKNRNENVDKRLNYYANAYQNPSNFYIDIEPCDRSEALYKLIQELRNKNIKMYCLSGMKFSFHFKAKQDFINTQYGADIELISAGTQELKLDGIKIISKLNKCNLDEVLYIEDLEDTVNFLKSNGINVINVNEMRCILNGNYNRRICYLW